MAVWPDLKLPLINLWSAPKLRSDCVKLLSYLDLIGLIEKGVITADPDRVKGSSIDITLDDLILLEDEPKFNKVVCLKSGESIETRPHRMDEGGYRMVPGEFVLGSTVEHFNMPLHLSAEYKLKSTLARNAFEHLGAGWIDPGFSGNLTLEMINCTRKHVLQIKPSQSIGQVVFFEHEPVPEEFSYRRMGQYNGQRGVTASKGLR
jgi:dCTP deaminase